MSEFYAYCKELNQVVSISVAQKEFLNETNITTNGKFHFYCPDENCIQADNKRTKMVGVNYTSITRLDEGKKFKVPHFRLFPNQLHSEACSVQRQTNLRLKDASNKDGGYSPKKAKYKLHDYVDVFDPMIRESSKSEIKNTDVTTESTNIIDSMRKTNGSNNIKLNEHGLVKTTQLERLVQTYLDAKENLSTTEFESLPLKVLGSKITKLKDYFKQIKFAKLGNNNAVLFGGAKFKPYGDNFALNFMDKLSNASVSIYIKRDAIELYQYKKYLRMQLLEEAKNADYVKVYALGELALQSENKISFDVELRHLVIIPVWKKKTHNQ